MFGLSFRKLVSDIEQDFLLRISDVFTVDAAEASHLYSLLLQCMDYRQAVSQPSAKQSQENKL